MSPARFASRWLHPSRHFLRCDARSPWLAALAMASGVSTTLALTLSLQAPVANAQVPSSPSDPGQSILILDASGSMWGQIGGRPKIEIAREAIKGMLGTWPQGNELGLMAYGHRSKGDCNDIEPLIAPAPLNREAFQSAVNALQPKGMTPITASVQQAAELLKSSERKATIILVSDGEETCKADPCAAVQELEKAGLDFTAHVIGFDIAKGSKAEKQLQCMAKESGGLYLDARDASSLNKALQSVSKGAPPVKVTSGQEWMPDVQLWWEAGSEIEGGRHERDDELGVKEFRKGQTAKECQALCTTHPACGAWVYNPPGSYFIDFPRCDLKGLGGALRVEKMEKGDGWVSGVKSGAKVMLQTGN